MILSNEIENDTYIYSDYSDPRAGLEYFVVDQPITKYIENIMSYIVNENCKSHTLFGPY